MPSPHSRTLSGPFELALAKAVPSLPTCSGILFEPKWDGFRSTLIFSSADLRAGHAEERRRQIVEEHRDQLFFRKNRDWESESEHRYLAISGSASELVPIDSALVGIVLGQGFPDTELSVLDDRLRRNGLGQVKCALLTWDNGVPYVFGDTDSNGQLWLVLNPFGRPA
ncbi:hypothetical protein SA2016_0836 [Sinomonas atrocyanea]|uniref:Uncharacterized protein n=1 Tax=Sinomonas atrocyanea TaxID=37927 RepID=A0A126ZY81_9MICC|nr:hypothetical protein [Sinomonas atrocyanea]AMM31524.1 hypothetical protein SA2016_0836 [Sinomonas atrocyanea]GEB65090.1 hypothetical protein SAT01_25380 [Sinomonas atrocyanea]GGG63365.1 hypothetical protein GCM10007172_13270 [Sinomonas atrocyanea]